MIRTIRVMLIPNNKQETKLFQYAGTARFAYNWALSAERENYKNGGKFLSDSVLRKEFTRLKKTKEYVWLNNVSNNIKYDGLNWYLTVGVEYEDSVAEPSGKGIGIDLGIKDFAVCSDGNIYQNRNKTSKMKKLEKRKRRLQRSISRRYENNKKGECYRKTSNIVKREKELLKVNHRLTNIRQNCLHQITSDIVKREPSFICDDEEQAFVQSSTAAGFL